jgi:hypothetical protein
LVALIAKRVWHDKPPANPLNLLRRFLTEQKKVAFADPVRHHGPCSSASAESI